MTVYKFNVGCKIKYNNIKGCVIKRYHDFLKNKFYVIEVGKREIILGEHDFERV